MRIAPVLLATFLVVTGAGIARSQALEVKDGSPLSLEICRIHADVEEGVALVDVDQTFRNSSVTVREGTYRFRLPADAVVSSFSMWMNGKEKHGRVIEAKTARRVYEEIVRKKKDPALLEQDGWRSFRVSVFPIPARDTVRIRLSYAYVLPDDLGLQTLEIPMIEGVGKIGDCTFRATVRGKREISLLDCPSHEKAKTKIDKSSGSVTWAAEGWEAKGPFLVRFMTEHDGLDLTLITHRARVDEEGFFLVRVLAHLPNPQPLPRDVVFVLDRSGSMQGEKIEQARSALLHGLSTLRKGDRFNVISFSTSTKVLQPRTLLPVNAETLDRARAEGKQIEAGGGTNIDQALQRAISLRDGAKGRLFLLVFLTDGQPTVGEKDPNRILASYQRKSLGKVRLFAFGVGNGVEDFLLTQLARGSRGAAVYVREEENLEVKLSSLFTKVGTPLLADPRIQVVGLETRDVVPEPLPDLFRGEALVLAGRYQGGGDARLRLVGRLGSGEVELNLPAKLPATCVLRPHVAQLWAKRKIDRLLDDLRVHGMVEEIKQSIIDLGVRYQVVTPYTSFIVVEDGIHIADPAELAKVPDADGGPVAGGGGSAQGPAKAAPAPVAPGTPGGPAAGGSSDAGGGGYRGPGGEVPPSMRQPQDPPAEGGGGTPPPDDGGGTSGGGSSGGSSSGNPSPASEPPPGDRNPAEPPPPSAEPEPDAGDQGGPNRSSGGTYSGPSSGGASPGGVQGPGGKKSGPAPVTFESWEFWWGYNRDTIQNLRSGLQATAGDNDIIVKTILPALAQVLADPKAPWYLRKQAVLALGRVGASRPAVSTRIAKRLIDILIDKDGKGHYSVVEEAALSLGVLQNKDEVVLDALCDRVLGRTKPLNLRSRNFAALALGLLRIGESDDGHDRVVKTLREALREPEQSQLPVCALIAMGLSGDGTFLPDLLEIVRKGRVQVDRKLTSVERAHAVSALGRLAAEIGGEHLPAAIKTLAKLTSSRDDSCARSAAIALGQIGRRGDLKIESIALIARHLTLLIKKAETQTACFALISLGRMGGAVESTQTRSRIFDLLRTAMRKGSVISRPYAALALGLMGSSPKLESVRHTIQDAVRSELERFRGDPRNRGAFAIAAGLLGDDKAAPILVKILTDPRADRRLRGPCAIALGMLGEMEALNKARKNSANRSIGSDLAVGLALSGDRRSTDALLDGLSDRRSSLFGQMALSLAIGRLGDRETVDRLVLMAKNDRLQDLNRAQAIATLGRMAALDTASILWRITMDVNYRASFNTLDEVAVPR
jgi:Ca-activated chloride channel homolog